MQVTELLSGNRIAVFGGAVGTALMAAGGHGAVHDLCVSHPDKVMSLYRSYIEAGADVVMTNSFCATESRVCEESARLARRVADDCGRDFAVAGSVGPVDRYLERMKALADGGADCIYLETVMSLSGMRRALDAAETVDLPVIVSATVDRSGVHLLSGEDVEEMVREASRYSCVVAAGLNCGYGPYDMAVGIRRIAQMAHLPLGLCPSAGLPDASGVYPLRPTEFASAVGALAAEGIISYAGGCCGTTPEYISVLAATLRGLHRQ